MSSAKLLVLLIFAFEIFLFVQGMYHCASFRIFHMELVIVLLKAVCSIKLIFSRLPSYFNI